MRRTWMWVLVMMLVGVGPAWGKDKSDPVPAAPEVTLDVDRSQEKLTWTVSALQLATGGTWKIRISPDWKVQSVQFGGKSGCSVKPSDEFAVIPDCASFRSLNGTLAVLLVTAGVDLQGTIRVEPEVGANTKIRLACGTQGNLQKCKADEVPTVWDVPNGLKVWGDECAILLTRWEACKTEISPERVWREGSAGAVRIRTRSDTGAPLLTYQVVPYEPPPPPPTDPKPLKPVDGWCAQAWYEQENPDARQLVCIDQRDVTVPGHLSTLRVTPPPSPLPKDRTLPPPEDKHGPKVNPTGGLLVANEPITVYVRMPSQFGATIDIEGEVGFESEGLLERSETMKLLRTDESPSKIFSWSVPSLKSGAIKIKLTYTQDTPAKSWPQAYPLYVDRRIWGAFRSGLAIGYSLPQEGVPYDRYSVGAATGSASAQILDDGGDQWLDSELTFGLTLYLGNLDAKHPLYESKLAAPRPGLYVGVGVLNLSAGSLEDALPALHMGPELSLGRNTGLALVASLRPKRALGLGLEAGDYATAGSTLPDRIVPTLGISVLLNLTPDALNLATGKSQ